MPVFFSDKFSISSKRTYTDEGFLLVPCRIGRTGIQKYLGSELGLTGEKANQIFDVYRGEEEVFKQETLDSFKHKPVTDDHPPVLVDASNYKKYAVGSIVSDVDRDGDYMDTLVQISDADSIANVENGKSELSLGYTCDIDFTPGVAPSGVSYDARQVDIVGNHLAIVKKGRAGYNCRIADNSHKGNLKMAILTIDGVDYETTEQVVQVVSGKLTQLKDAESEAEEAKAKAKKAEDEKAESEKEKSEMKDSMQATIDATLAKVPTADKLDELVAERLGLVAKASKVLGDVDLAGKSEREIKIMVGDKAMPDLKVGDKSDAYIDGIFDTAISTVSNNPQHSLDQAFRTIVTNDSAPAQAVTLSPSQAAREKFMKDSQSAWQTSANKGSN